MYTVVWESSKRATAVISVSLGSTFSGTNKRSGFSNATIFSIHNVYRRLTDSVQYVSMRLRPSRQSCQLRSPQWQRSVHREDQLKKQDPNRKITQQVASLQIRQSRRSLKGVNCNERNQLRKASNSSRDKPVYLWRATRGSTSWWRYSRRPSRTRSSSWTTFNSE